MFTLQQPLQYNPRKDRVMSRVINLNGQRYILPSSMNNVTAVKSCTK